MAKKKIGRPTKFNQELADYICERLATSSDSLGKICKEINVTTVSVYSWLNDVNHIQFLNSYTRAREDQADWLADEIIEIADQCRLGKKTVQKGKNKEITTGDMVDRSKLMIEARKWISGKLKPKKYGDRVAHIGGEGEPLIPTKVVFEVVTSQQKEEEA